jgi:hypothetical protein
MQTSIWEKIADTPWWFFLFVIGFISLAWVATKPKIIPIKNLLLMPAIYIPFSLLSIALTIPINRIVVLLWLTGTLTGIVIGWLHFRILNIKAVKNKSSLYVPGTWSLFGLILLITATKYYYGYSLMIDPKIFIQAEYVNYFITLYGLFAGIFIGKIIYSLRCIKVGPFITQMD